MANQAPVMRLEGFGPEDTEDAEFGGPNIHPSTFTIFLKAAVTGKMPGGVQTSQPLFPTEYIQQFSTKYVDWAPPPFDKLPPPAMNIGGINLGSMPGDSPPAMIRVMHALSGLDKMFGTLSSNPVQQMKPSPKAMRMKLWWGMPPISDALWASKELDSEENIEEAMAIIQQAVDVFKRQLKPEIQGELRTTHNQVWTEIDVFQDAIIALRSLNGEPAPEFNIAKLWLEYTELHYQYMEKQARAWVFKRLAVLFDHWKDRMMRVFHSGRILSDTQATIRIDHWAMMILNKLLDLYVEAEMFLRFRTDGFSMRHGIHQNMIGSITLDKTEAELNAIYAGMENQRVANMRGALATYQTQRTNDRHESAPVPDFLEALSVMFDREISMRSIMYEMDTPNPLGVESWVQYLASAKLEKFGFVVYRNTYSQSEMEWKSFLETFEASLNSGWEGMLDPENIRSKATLQWVDGKEEGIAEGDIEAVRQHFKGFAASPNFPTHLTPISGLAITPHAYKSFLNPERKGDYRGFLTVVDPSYDPTKQPQTQRLGQSQRQDKYPAYKGHFNIIDQLVWTDLFALQISLGAQKMQEYFRLAVPHPWAVYVGPTTGVKRKQWRLMNEGAKGVWKYLRFLTRSRG